MNVVANFVIHMRQLFHDKEIYLLIIKPSKLNLLLSFFQQKYKNNRFINNEVILESFFNIILKEFNNFKQPFVKIS